MYMAQDRFEEQYHPAQELAPVMVILDTAVGELERRYSLDSNVVDEYHELIDELITDTEHALHIRDTRGKFNNVSVFDLPVADARAGLPRWQSLRDPLKIRRRQKKTIFSERRDRLPLYTEGPVHELHFERISMVVQSAQDVADRLCYLQDRAHDEGLLHEEAESDGTSGHADAVVQFIHSDTFLSKDLVAFQYTWYDPRGEARVIYGTDPRLKTFGTLASFRLAQIEILECFSLEQPFNYREGENPLHILGFQAGRSRQLLFKSDSISREQRGSLRRFLAQVRERQMPAGRHV